MTYPWHDKTPDLFVFDDQTPPPGRRTYMWKGQDVDQMDAARARHALKEAMEAIADDVRNRYASTYRAR